jgi:hypothetical protein
MTNMPRTNETDLLHDLLDAAYNDRPRAHQLCDTLFGAAEIADDPTLAYTIALMRQTHIGRNYVRPPYRPLRCTTWRNGKAFAVEIPTDPHERRFPHRH